MFPAQDQDLIIVLYLYNLVGGWATPLKNDGVRQWVSDDIPFSEMENNPFHGLKPPTSDY